MSYCNTGDNPKVLYQFGSASQQVYQSSLSPIDVEVTTTPPDATSNYNPNGLWIRFGSPQGEFLYIDAYVVDYYLYNDPVYGPSIALKGCGGGFFLNPVTGLPNGHAVISSPVVIEGTNACPLDATRYYLLVKYQGQIIFQDSGTSSPTFTVQCGKCPDGQCECASNKYPGYCCSDCGNTAAQINAITQLVRAKNHGR